MKGTLCKKNLMELVIVMNEKDKAECFLWAAKYQPIDRIYLKFNTIL